jgi:hypothetical protein
MKMCEKTEIYLHVFLTSVVEGVGVHSHISARYQSAGRMDRTQNRSGCGEEKKYSLPLPRIELQFIGCPVLGLVTMQTELLLVIVEHYFRFL